MPRKPKDFEYLSIKLDKRVADRLNEFCTSTARNKTAAVEMLLTKYFDEYDQKKSND